MKLGKNDPCHCGSGEKYKKCHLAEDDAKKLAELNAKSAAAQASAAGAEDGTKAQTKHLDRARESAPQQRPKPAKVQPSPIRRGAV